MAFLAGPPEAIPPLVERLRIDCPDARWELVCFGDPCPPAAPDTTIIAAAGTATFAARLWLRVLRRSYRAVYIACAGSVRPEALATLVEFVSVLPCRRKFLLDEDGLKRAVGGRTAAATALSLVLTPALLGLARLVTVAGLRVCRGGPPPPPTGGRVAILVPILPDLSHTFVYREVLEVKRRHPEYEVLTLEVGDREVVHLEAAELMKVAEVVPRLSRNRYLAAYLVGWFRRPRAMAGLIRFLAPHTESFGPGARRHDEMCLLRLEYLHHGNYPILGVMLAACLQRKRISYVHVYGATYPAVRALVANRLLGIRFSLSTFVDFDYVTPYHMLAPKVQAARFVVTCTEYCRRQLSRRFPEAASKLRVLHHALRHDYAEGKPFRARDGSSRLVYVGRFVPKKGLETLIEACAILRARGVETTCHLYGKGETQPELARLIARHHLEPIVRFEGVIPNEALYQVMNQDDVFVSPSRYMADGERDGIPVTLLEAMAAGITVVSTPVSGIPELVTDGVNGYLVPENDPAALAERLESLIRVPERRTAVSAAARSTVQERFSLERSGARLAGWISRESRS